MDLTTATNNSEINMHKTIKHIVAGSVMTVSIFSGTAQAGIQEQIKSKVDSIKTDTNTLKTRTSSLVTKANEQIQRLDEVGSTVNAVIAETDVIKGALEPLDIVRSMKDRFSEIDFDPSELLEGDKLSKVIETYKAKQAAIEERLNDPDLETFRAEFATTLQQTREILTPVDEEAEPLPLQTVVEIAPVPVIAALKFAVGPVFPKMRDTVGALHTETEALRAIRLWGHGLHEAYQCEQDVAAHERNKERAYEVSEKLVDLIEHWKLVDLKIEVREWEIGVHGYTGTRVTTGDDTKQQIQSFVIRLEAEKAKMDMQREKLNFASVTCG